MRVVAHEKGFAIASSWSPALVAASKATPGMRWDAAKRVWAGPLDAIHLVVSRLVSKGLRINIRALEQAEKVGDPVVPFATKGLRDYQIEAVKFLLDRKRALLSDDMGLGKSCSALTAARALDARTLIVCPSYVRGVWWNAATGGEIKKWWPASKNDVCLPTGVRGDVAGGPTKNTRIVVIHYDILHAWVRCLSVWAPRVVIFDEGHALMSEKSRRSKAAREVSKGAEMVWALTGTPMTNRPADLWNVADTLRPGVFGSFFAFGLRYCDAHKEAVTPQKTVWKFDGKSNLEELNSRLKHFMLRRTKKEVALELPPKTRQIMWVDVPSKGRVLTATNAKELRASLERAADLKLIDVTSLVLENAQAGHRVVCFTYRRSVAEHIATCAREKGVDAEFVHGGIPTLKRGAALERARGSKSGHILAATIDSSSTGIDLSYADVCVFAELDYKPHALLQAESRLHRFGQASPVLIQYVVARNTTDEIVANVVIEKLDAFEQAVGSTGDTLGTDLAQSDDDVLGQLIEAIERGKSRR